MAASGEGGGPALTGAEHRVTIERIAAGGDGVGRLPDGRVIFVPRTAPGDEAFVQVTRDQSRFTRGRLVRLDQASSSRTAPRCLHYDRDECGGCQLMHLNDTAQSRALETIVGDAVRRIGKLPVDDPPLELAAERWEYRTKLSLTRGRGGLGFHRFDRPGEVFPLETCLVASASLNALWSRLRAARRFFPGELERLVLRLDRLGGEHAILEVAAGPVWKKAAELHRAAIGSAPLTIWWRPAGGAARALAGGEAPFPATVFEQVHPLMGDRVRAHAIEALAPLAGTLVWDLYAGIGESSRMLSERGAVVESVERDRRAVDEAARAGGARVTRLVGAAEDLVGTLGRPNRVLCNPPRTGMDRRVCEAITDRRPDRIAYISCDPATLARDLMRLGASGKPGARYRLEALVAFDLFPQTAHVETVAVLERA